MQVIFKGGTDQDRTELTAGQLAGWKKRFGWKAQTIAFKLEPGQVVFECTDKDMAEDMRKRFKSAKSRLFRGIVKSKYGIEIILKD